MILLSGKPVRNKILNSLREDILAIKIKPELVIIQVGENPESEVYIKQKKIFGDEIGVKVNHVLLEDDVTEESIVKEIDKYNKDNSVTGIIVQLPLPENINVRKILDSIGPEKDVDGLGTVQAGLLSVKNPKAIVPATARGVMSLLDYYEVALEGKHVVIVGRSDLVGKPTALCSLHRNATVTICHSHTKNLEDVTKTADILISACGIPKFINKSHVKSGQVVIDVGIHKTDSGICGDADFDEVKDIVSSISPVPGGIGPLTVASLFQNLIDSYNSNCGIIGVRK